MRQELPFTLLCDQAENRCLKLIVEVMIIKYQKHKT